MVDRIQSSPVFSSDHTCLSLMLESQSFHLLPGRRLSLESARTRPRKATVGTLYAIGGMDKEKGEIGAAGDGRFFVMLICSIAGRCR